MAIYNLHQLLIFIVYWNPALHLIMTADLQHYQEFYV